ncbi:MAG: RagB/SusD family nutrient uptake outer membrane protein [Bacteroidota bacterium]
MIFPGLSSCSDSWLDAKPNKSLVVPESISDFQALLDNVSQTFNFFQASGLAEISSGDFFITNASYLTLFTTQEKSAYTWAPTPGFYNAENSSDWENSYKRILNSNVVLEGIAKINPGKDQQVEWNRVKGSALFFRAVDFYGLTQEYCTAYNPKTAANQMGVPLRLEYNVNIKLKRASLEQTYSQLIGDLKASSALLDTRPLIKTRPSKQAAFAMLARVYLSMEDYPLAGIYADSAMLIQSDLIDYSNLNIIAAYPIVKFNTEVIFHNTFTYGIFTPARLLVDPSLYSSYAANDYRRTIFFKAATGGVTYKGNYTGDRTFFGGLATDELYLIRAEVNARKGAVKAAVADLNTLLKKRFQNNFLEVTENNAESVLALVLAERRKELLFRGLRWSDLRRLNRDPRFAVTLSRTLNNVTYTLLPNDKRYVFPLDDQEITLTGITQNDR